MSANIYWAPTGEGHILKDVTAPSHFIRTMTEVFGDPPWHLDEDNEAILRAMGAAYDTEQNPYKTLAGIISLRKSIKVWASY